MIIFIGIQITSKFWAQYWFHYHDVYSSCFGGSDDDGNRGGGFMGLARNNYKPCYQSGILPGVRTTSNLNQPWAGVLPTSVPWRWRWDEGVVLRNTQSLCDRLGAPKHAVIMWQTWCSQTRSHYVTDLVFPNTQSLCEGLGAPKHAVIMWQTYHSSGFSSSNISIDCRKAIFFKVLKFNIPRNALWSLHHQYSY